MKKLLIVLVILMMAIPSALASTAADVAKEYAEILEGRWLLAYSGSVLAPDDFDFDADGVSGYGKISYMIVGSGDGTARIFMDYGETMRCWLGTIYLTSDSNTMILDPGTGDSSVYKRSTY